MKSGVSCSTWVGSCDDVDPSAVSVWDDAAQGDQPTAATTNCAVNSAAAAVLHAGIADHRRHPDLDWHLTISRPRVL
jgi:hypothetical protein